MIKLAVPENPVFKALYIKADLFKDTLKVYPVKENETQRLLFNHQVDAALITPLGYSQGIMKNDLRIIPSKALIAVGYTGLASIFFKSGLEKVNRIGTNSADDFLIIMASILISEKYGIVLKPEITKLRTEEIQKQYDMSFLWEKSRIEQQALDITEEWFDFYEMPLPIAFWACRYEDSIEDITNIVSSISDLQTNEEIINENDEQGKYFHREGKIQWNWNDDAEAALEQVLQLLYFHQLSDEIAAVKILGRD